MDNQKEHDNSTQKYSADFSDIIGKFCKFIEEMFKIWNMMKADDTICTLNFMHEWISQNVKLNLVKFDTENTHNSLSAPATMQGVPIHC